MEGNRDEAEKCIGIAREALEAGNRDRALRFLGKAQKLYPTETARVLLEAITKNGSAAGGGAYCRKPASNSDQSKPNSTKESNASAAGESGKGYNKDQMEGVLRNRLTLCSKSISRRPPPKESRVHVHGELQRARTADQPLPRRMSYSYTHILPMLLSLLELRRDLVSPWMLEKRVDVKLYCVAVSRNLMLKYHLTASLPTVKYR
ncbi:dnaJ homolog subfamily B member 14 isoform X3 [Pyrgilauda ruficollis]|uniref:dnaJ homolog subfamily B member 14 isoform X3 n=1 Tax=Pyrgilauda ruficollis TaxID=221976 RepID=UPI001B8802C0|nr:dnaJ homolog subfamily B member 14 isoform X3 [Pyrgilauda ruficollis]